MISYFLSVVTVLSCALQGNFCFAKSNFEKILPNIKQQNFNIESTISNVYNATKNGDITNDYLVDYKQMFILNHFLQLILLKMIFLFQTKNIYVHILVI